MVTANVDIPALKARHPLGDTVEASGVRLRGRGRVRQGVCPFHDEVEGSFTVYGDSERFYCFGCGEGGDVLDFVRRVENLSLPEAIARLDGSPGLAPRAAVRPAGARRPKSAALPPRDPALLTAAARFYAGRLRRQPGGAGSTWPRGASACPRQPAWASATRRAAGCESPLSRTASPPTGSGTAGCSWSGERSGSPGWSSFPTPPAVSSAGSSAGPSTPAGRPGSKRCPAPSRCLGWGVSALRRPGRSWPRDSSTGSPLPDGAFRLPQPWAPMAWSGSPRPSGAAPASSSPSTTTTRAARLRSGFRPCSDAGPPPSPFPPASATWPSLPPFPRDRAAFLRLLAQAARSAR